MKPIAENNEILALMPQRPPIVMVDKLWSIGDDVSMAVTGLNIKGDNIFVESGVLQEPGIIEHVAQSAAVMEGYGCKLKGEKVQINYLCEVKKFEITTLPAVGSELETQVTKVAQAGGVTLLSAKVECNGTPIASGQMKISIGE